TTPSRSPRSHPARASPGPRSTATLSSAPPSSTTSKARRTAASPRSPTNLPPSAKPSRPSPTPFDTTTRNSADSPADNRVTQPNPNPETISRISRGQRRHGKLLLTPAKECPGPPALDHP